MSSRNARALHICFDLIASPGIAFQVIQDGLLLISEEAAHLCSFADLLSMHTLVYFTNKFSVEKKTYFKNVP